MEGWDGDGMVGKGKEGGWIGGGKREMVWKR